MQGWSLFAASFLVGLSGAVMPGPLMTVAIAGVGRLGAVSGLVASLGHGVPEALLVVALAYGFGEVLRIPSVSGTIAVLGGLILVWMAVGMFRSAQSTAVAAVTGPAGSAVATDPTASGPAAAGRATAAPDTAAPAVAIPATMGAARGAAAGPKGSDGGLQARSRWRWARPQPALSVMGAGAMASISNPYWILWWATIGAGYVTQALATGWYGVGLFFGGHILSDVAWLGFVSALIAAGSRFLSPAFYGWLIRILALFLVALAVYFLLTGYRLLAG